MTETPKNSETSKRTRSWWSKNWFYTVLIAVALIGGLSAFGLPLIVPQPYSAGDSISTLRQAILAATGGILAILTLWENRRKNIQEKEKNDQDHTRQVHAERRARYAKAIEQLADGKAPIRLGGVYTLIKLVDDWLDDEKTLPNKEERQEEGQVIIDSLCAYIRSPFDLASKTEELSEHKEPENYEGGNQQFIKDQARFREEKELRLTILETVRNRLNKGTRVHKNGTQKLLPGQWSGFDYDFSNTVFFYPVGFNNSYFGASSNFSGAKFTKDADFSGATFTRDADFTEATFTRAYFSRAKFTENADFIGATFTRAEFSEAEFTRFAYFSWATFTRFAYFFGAKFTGDATFSGATFSGATFTGDATFTGATFTKKANFLEATFEEKPQFEYALGNKTYKARFSCKADPEDYNFEVSDNSRYKIETEEKEYDEAKFIIPKGTELFDPDEPSEQDNNDGN